MADTSWSRGASAWQSARGATGRADVKKARLRKIYLIGAVMLLLAGALAGLALYLRETPRPTLVVLRIDQYRDARIPVSPWSSQDREGLRQLGLEEKNTFTSQERELLRQALGQLGREQRTDQPLMVYLCAYAAVQDDGSVALLPADAKLDDATTWLPFREVLTALQQCPVKHRLLVLDLGLPCVDPRAGLLAANVPERLKAALETAVQADPNLAILASCAPGQTSQASEELGHTVFGHYLIQGLAGRADGFPSKKTDNRVSLRELIAYVTMQVDRWAYANTGQRQTPEFFGNPTTDYELTGTEGIKTPETAPLPSEYPPFLLNGWTERDQWWSNLNQRTPPMLYQRLEQTLLRAEERWRKGEDAVKVESDLKSALARLQLERTEKAGAPDVVEVQSLAEAVARGQKPPEAPIAESLRPLKELGTLWIAAKQAKPSEMDVALLVKKTADFLKKYDDKPFELAWTIFLAALKDTDLRQEHLRCWCELLRAEGRPLPRYEEIRFLVRLAELPVAKPEEWPSAASEALQLAELAAKVETLRPMQQPWLIAEYVEAKRRREQAEKLLLSLTPSERQEAGKPIVETLQAYGDLYQHLQTLRGAHRLRDEALVFLPGYAGYLEHDPTRVDLWLDAMQNTRSLNDMLSKTPDAEAVQTVLRQVGERSSTLRNSLKNLRDPLTNPLARDPIADSRPPRSADALEMRALLRLPGLTAKERKTIWKNARDVAGRLNTETVQREATADPLSPPDDARAVRLESDRAQVRAQISQGMLRLAGSADVEKVDAARKRVARAPLEEPAWEALRKELRQAWKRQESATSRP